MRIVAYQTVWMVIFCAVFTSLTFAADTLIYNNSNLTDYIFRTSSTYTEFLDYGTSPGGRISKFAFDYYTGGSPAGTIWVRFYTATDYYTPGYSIKEFALTSVLPSSPSYFSKYEYIIPENQRFDLPSGNFGYSFEFSSASTYAAVASGGQGNENWLWVYDNLFEDFFISYIQGTWSGISMQIYTAPPIDVITCDISGYKFNDTNGNGIWNAGEPALKGWEFYLDINNNGICEESEPNVITDPNGRYFFENMDSPATYRIREIVKAGWSQTLPGASGSYQYVVATDPNHAYGPYNFGNAVLVFNSSISGTIFQDNNGNSIRDAGEPGLSGWRAYIDTDGNGRYGSGEPTAVANASGNYQITSLATGVYTVAEEMVSGWVQTYPTAACTHTVTISTSGQTVSSINFGNHTFNAYGGGSGTQASPYLIYHHLHLQAIGAHKGDWNKHFKLMNNIDLSKYVGEQFNLIGRYNFADQTTPFGGVFDGNGFAISNFTYYYQQTPQEYIGLFGYLWYGTIKNLRLQNVNVNAQGGGVYGSALAGWLRDNSTISNCHVAQGTVTAKNFGAAGLIGSSGVSTVTDCSVTGLNVTCTSSTAGGVVCENKGTIHRCSFEGTVYGQGSVGGLVGYNQGAIGRCYANASVNGFQRVGGLVGENVGNGSISQGYSQGLVQTHTDPQSGLAGNTAGGLAGYNSGGSIFDSYSTASVSSVSRVGGLVGVCWGQIDGPGLVKNCYAAGAVSGTSTIGGLIGWNIDGWTVISQSLWDKQTTGRTTSDGGIGQTTVNMKLASTYLSQNWDLATVWWICGTADYPRLRWGHEPAGDFVCPAGVDEADLMVLMGQWLTTGASVADIAPAGALDGKVDMLDYAVFAQNWLKSI